MNRKRILGVTAALWVSACASASTAGESAVTLTESAATAVTMQPTTGEAVDPVDAAVRYVAATDSLVAHSAVGRNELLRRLVTADALGEHAEALESALAEVAVKLDVPVERLTWVEAPISASLARSTGTSATVDVWTVSVFGAPDAGSPQQVWRTVHVDLQRTDDGWLVAASTADAGPTPAANELALHAGWAEFEAVASWPAVVDGETL